jgi:hypothetical protein
MDEYKDTEQDYQSFHGLLAWWDKDMKSKGKEQGKKILHQSDVLDLPKQLFAPRFPD